MRPKISHSLIDWRHLYGGAFDPAELPMSVSITQANVQIETSDGRVLSIELEGERLRVHAYARAQDAPVTLELDIDRIGLSCDTKLIDTGRRAA